METETIKTIKGFDHELKCRGYQYEIGKTYTAEGKIAVCSNGFHAIRNDVNPLSVFEYYAPVSSGKPSRYCIVECSGEIEYDDNKLCCSVIKIDEEITLDKLHDLSQAWVESHSDNTEIGGDGSALSGGDGSALSGSDESALRGGYGSSLSGGYGSALRGGNRSALSGSDESALRGGYGSSLSGGYGSALSGGNESALRGDYGSALRGGYGSALRGGDGSALRGGNGSALRGGNESALSGGDESALSGGNRSALRGGNRSKFCGGKWSTFFVEIRDNNGKITGIGTATVDGVNIKEYQWYEFNAPKGEWIECDAPDNAIFE